MANESKLVVETRNEERQKERIQKVYELLKKKAGGK